MMTLCVCGSAMWMPLVLKQSQCGRRLPAADPGATGCLVLNIAVRRIQVDSVTERSSVPYTYKSLAVVWLITFGLFGLTASGVVATSWLLLFLVVGLATPALIL